MDKARLAAYNAVKRIFAGAYSNLIPTGEGLNGVDRAFAESIALGTLERKLTLEYIIAKFIKKAAKRDLSALIMTGVYQIFYMDKVPDSAACNETVDLAKTLFGKSEAGFVNAVLREICRNKEKLVSEIDNSGGEIRYSVDKSIFELIKSQYPDDYEKIFDAFFGKQPLYLRINTLKTSANAVASSINGRMISEKTVVAETPSVALAEIENGLFYVQGLASQKAVEALGAMPNELVVDVCACPGGKTLGAAIDMENRGRIYSFDIHENKLSLIDKSAKRLGIDIITARKRDARMPDETLFGSADRVICDVPCSGSGVMGSKPEIKYKSAEDFKGLYPIQKAIINASAKYLKIGGRMVYSTCSINKKENEEIVDCFLCENNNFKLVSQKTYLPFGEEGEGFFVAAIIRES